MKKILFILLLPFIMFSCMNNYSIGENKLNEVLKSKFNIEKEIGVVKVKLTHINTTIEDSKIRTQANLNLSSYGFDLTRVLEVSYGLKFEDNKLYLKDVKIEKISDDNGGALILNNPLVKGALNYIIDYLTQTPVYDFSTINLPLGKIITGIEVLNKKINFNLK